MQATQVRDRSRHSGVALARALAALSPLALWIACTGQVAGTSPGTGSGQVPDPGTTTSPDPNGAAGAATGGGKVDFVGSVTCGPGSEKKFARAGLARLTNEQYANTIRDLLTGMTMPAIDLPDENRVHGFENNAEAQTPAFAFVEQYANQAISMARAASGQISKLAPCAGTTAADQNTCGTQFIASFGKRAFRRPLTTDEASRFGQFFQTSLGQYDYPTAIRMVTQAFLQSPQFLYRLELGANGDANKGDGRLSDFEIATRLSYFLTGTMPDADLMAAADAGQLQDKAGRAAQIERVLNSPGGHAGVAAFHARWLESERVADLKKDAKLFPTFDAATQQSMRASYDKFLDWAFWDQKGSLTALFTAQKAFVDAKLAPIYGVPSPGAALALTDVGAKRSGLLTQAGWLAARAHEKEDAPVLRSVTVLDRLLCDPSPPPPPNIANSFPAADDGAPKTVRQRFETVHETGACAACHKRIDAVGFAFSHFDAVGRWMDTDRGMALDDKATLVGTKDADGPIEGAAGLGQKLAASKQVAMCVTAQWFRYALARSETAADGCLIQSLSDAFVAGGRNTQDLARLIAASDAFVRSTPATP